MRRNLTLAGIFVLGLLVAVPTLATGAGTEVERELVIGLDVEGFDAGIFVNNNDGDVSATLIVSRGAQVAYYSVPATVTADRVTARFGKLGALDFHFAPKPNGKVECTGSENGEAVFEGSFAFTGENGYVHIETDRTEGTYQVYPEPKTCTETRSPRGSSVRPRTYHPTYSGDGVTLDAMAGSRRQGRAREISVFHDGSRGPQAAFLFAFLVERREGMSIARGVQTAAGAGAFRWNLKKGTASLRPPAPFTGSATFRRGRSGPGTWRGSLGMPVLGGEPLRLAGREFRAVIHKGLPQDE
ncbi:MAG: hypothetical protein ACTHNY_03380 [Solirubrobacterales bacterium]